MENDEYDFAREQADADEADLEQLGRLTELLRRKGICVHGWRQTFHPTNPAAAHLKPGQVECLECHTIASAEDLDAERDQRLGR